MLTVSGSLAGCPARPPRPPAAAETPTADASERANPNDGLLFAEELVDGLLKRTEQVAPADTKGAPAKDAGTAPAPAPVKPTDVGEPPIKATPTAADMKSANAACNKLCERGTVCVGKLIDANEARVRRPSEAKKRLADNELMCRDDCDDRMSRARSLDEVVATATKCVKAPDCEAFMRCVEQFFEDD